MQARLQELILLSESLIGFFPKTESRAIEYPWFADKIQDCEGKSILDIGAGVNVLPFWLDERGAQVTTIDFHPTLIRKLEDKESWNEWGFLDYSLISPNIISHNINILNYQSDAPFDIIYSVSVIEHMPKHIREATFAKIESIASKNSDILISIDLIPNTNYLWNMNEGQFVAAPEQHGSVDTLKSEMTKAGLTITEETIKRGIPNSRTDILFLTAKLNC